MSGTCSHWGNGKAYHILRGLDNLWDFRLVKCIIPGQKFVRGDCRWIFSILYILYIRVGLSHAGFILYRDSR